ncbi:hypothetical protein GW17_00017080 [Ensete ventricosum]|nr:hypothetical protein GW17_00017080 [Ensete ventricosum]
MAEEPQLRLDLDELRHLESIAKRPRVLSLLSSEIRDLNAKVPPLALPPSIHRRFILLLQIYISIEDAEQEKVDTVLKSMSVDIKFHDIHGKNYRFAIPKLNKEILPEKCKLVVKPNKVIVTLVKASKGNWLDLHLKEDKVLTFLMIYYIFAWFAIFNFVTWVSLQNMYEEGDDEMKRTIAKAWSDARCGKAADPLKSYP